MVAVGILVEVVVVVGIDRTHLVPRTVDMKMILMMEWKLKKLND